MTDWNRPRAVDRLARRGAAIGWVVTGLLVVAALLPSVTTQTTTFPAGSGLAGDVVTTVVTTLNAWGTNTTVISPSASGLTVSAGNGPNFGHLLVFCALVLFGAAVARVAPVDAGLRAVLAAAAPIVTGIVAGIAASQILVFLGESIPTRPGTPGPATGGPVSSWSLGPSPWLATAAAVVGLATWVMVQRSGHQATDRERQTTSAASHPVLSEVASIDDQIEGSEVGRPPLESPARTAVDAADPRSEQPPAEPVDESLYRRPGDAAS